MAAAVYAALLGHFVSWPGLRSVVDDSMSYFVMAQAMTPFSETHPAITQVLPREIYPPVFPLLLALTGNAENVAGGRWLTLICGTLSLLLLFFVARRSLGSSVFALAICLLVGFAYRWWIINLQVLSELPFLLGLVGLLAVERSVSVSATRRDLMRAAMVTALVLTRSVGIVLLPAMLARAVLARHDEPHAVRNALLGVTVAATAMLAWKFLSPAEGPGRYTKDLLYLTEVLAEQGLAAYLGTQLTAAGDAWMGFWLPLWQPGFEVQTVLLTMLVMLCLAGVVHGMRKGEMLAWFVAGFVALVSVWPFKGQLSRLFIPIIPLLILYGAEFARHGLSHTRLPAPRQAQALGAGLALWLALALPGLGFIASRHAEMAADPELRRIVELYATHDPFKAYVSARQQVMMFSDYERIRAALPDDALVMTYAPGYIALLARRRSVVFPEPDVAGGWGRAIFESGATHVYLSSIKPRRTTENGLAPLPLFAGWTRILWRSISPEDQVIASVMMEIDRERLGQSLLDPDPPAAQTRNTP